MNLDEVVRQHREGLKGAAREVEEEVAFHLGLPCALVKAGAVVSTTLNGLRSHLPCSTALASEPIERFLRLKGRVGFDAAFEARTADDGVGEEFVEAWDQARKDLVGGVVVTLNDLVTFVEQAKTGFAVTPRRMLVVVVAGKVVESCTVATDWVLGGAI